MLWYSSAFLISALLFTLNVFMIAQNYVVVSNQTRRIDHASEVILSLEKLLSSVKDAETGVRGYILAQNQTYLEPFHAGKEDAWKHLSHLQNILAGIDRHKIRLEEIQSTLTKRLSILERVVDGSNEGQLKNYDFLNEGKAVMDTLRRQVQELIEAKRATLAMEARDVETSKNYLRWMFVFLNAMTLLLMCVVFFFVRRGVYESLKSSSKLETESWIKTNLAEISRVQATEQDIEMSSDEVLRILVENSTVVAARLFVFDGNQMLPISAYASPKSQKKQVVQKGEGLLGEAILKNEISEITSVPSDYFEIESALGSAKPNRLVFVPLKFHGKNVGIIEMAMFEPPHSAFLEFLIQAQELVGAGLVAAKNRRDLQQLLEKTQQQSEELQAQQEELRVSNEELEQQTRVLESQQDSLRIKNSELEEARKETEAKAQDLNRTSQYKSEFLAKMSHELRTPLNSLLILSNLLVENREKNLKPKQIEFASSIHHAGVDLLNLINDILDLSKIESRKLKLNIERVSVRTVIENLKITFLPQVEVKKLTFRIDVDEEILSMSISTDLQRLEQVLRNFLSNAIKFTEVGEICLRAYQQNDRVCFAVKDSGIGVPEAKKHLIFEAFEQGDGSISRRFGGTGLGLTISREISKLLGGEISVKSEEGVGSEFSLSLPLELPYSSGISAALEPASSNLHSRAEKKVHPTPISSSAELALSHLQPGDKTILIVEDDDVFRKSVMEEARRYKFIPIEAATGETALEILHRHRPSAILLDIKLPGMSGMGLLETIKENPAIRHIPIHMISGLEYQQAALRMGAIGYLTKPVSLDKINSALERIEKLIVKRMKKLLIIEDDEVQRNSLKELVSASDIEVDSAATGESALKKISEMNYDCIVLDLSLPDLSGYDLLERLNGLSISIPPIVIYTGQELDQRQEEFLRKYSESIIVKGVKSPERLLDEVNLFLHRVESLLPEDKREMLSQLRSQEKVFENKTVLLVDDDLRNVFALTHALEARGLQVRVARNGVEALSSLEEHQDINLVLMDIMMPKMDGFEAMRRIRAQKKFAQLPIVALTAKAMKEDHEKCIEAGANDYLPKPIHLDNLGSVLKVWLSPQGIIQW